MNATAQHPSLVMIIRHGEKPGDPSNDKDGGPDLSVLGSARAAALPSLFTPDATAPPVANSQQITCNVAVASESQFTAAYGSSLLEAGQSRFPTPTFLFSTTQVPPGTGSNRPVETITPLAQALQFFLQNPKITIALFANDIDGINGLVAEITGKPEIYGGQVVLICWHHGTIPQLVEAFGVPTSQLPWPKWPPTVFDLVFRITWEGSQANLAVDCQQLLYGDTAAAAISAHR